MDDMAQQEQLELCRASLALKHLILSLNMWFPEEEAKLYLNRALDLPASGNEQDWEVELANPNRIGDFINFLNSTEINQDTKKALVSLIIASFEDLLATKQFDSNLWGEIEKILVKDPEAYRDIIEYWSSTACGDGFRISELLEKVKQG